MKLFRVVVATDRTDWVVTNDLDQLTVPAKKPMNKAPNAQRLSRFQVGNAYGALSKSQRIKGAARNSATNTISPVATKNKITK